MMSSDILVSQHQAMTHAMTHRARFAWHSRVKEGDAL